MGGKAIVLKAVSRESSGLREGFGAQFIEGTSGGRSADTFDRNYCQLEVEWAVEPSMSSKEGLHFFPGTRPEDQCHDAGKQGGKTEHQNTVFPVKRDKEHADATCDEK